MRWTQQVTYFAKPRKSIITSRNINLRDKSLIRQSICNFCDERTKHATRNENKLSLEYHQNTDPKYIWNMYFIWWLSSRFTSEISLITENHFGDNVHIHYSQNMFMSISSHEINYVHSLHTEKITKPTKAVWALNKLKFDQDWFQLLSRNEL